MPDGYEAPPAEPEVEPEVLFEVELPPYGGKATSGLRIPRAEPCLRMSSQLRDELSEVPDMVKRLVSNDELVLSEMGSFETVRDSRCEKGVGDFALDASV